MCFCSLGYDGDKFEEHTSITLALDSAVVVHNLLATITIYQHYAYSYCFSFFAIRHDFIAQLLPPSFARWELHSLRQPTYFK